MSASRLIICALGASRPGTMGGNTKITVEMARCLATEREVHVFLPQHKLPTFTDNLPADHKIVFHTLEDYPKDDKFHPLGASRWYLKRARELFRELAVNSSDFVFGCSDFHIDVLPLYPLRKEFGFRWIPSVFLFVPFITENLAKGYRFPAIKYLIYWFYQRALFFLMKRRATAFVVTNESDFAKFPKRFANKLFAYYGGVNVEQIPEMIAKPVKQTPEMIAKPVKQTPEMIAKPVDAIVSIASKQRNPSLSDAFETNASTWFKVVFCSRLHPQKGIDGFLDIWKEVQSSILHLHLLSTPSLTIIGNGDPAYEAYLKSKAERLGIASSVTWLGYVNNEAKYEIYAKADLFVHPTIFDNNGMVAAEALCTGLPVVMYDLPALRHVYTTGCAKVPYGDRGAFAAKIVELASDSAKLAALAPSPSQLASLRAHWRWESRAAEFAEWLDRPALHNFPISPAVSP